MLLEIAIGDAYGRGFEGTAPDNPDNTVSGYARPPRHQTAVGRYTDDTQMSLAIAEALVEDDPWVPATLAQRFVDVHRRDAYQHRGYARGFGGLLREVADGVDLLRRLVPASERSGAAMRAGPIGLLPDLGEVRRRAEVQARITHDTRNGVDSAVAAALLTHHCAYYPQSRPLAAQFLMQQVPGEEWSRPWHGSVALAGIDCVHAAVSAVSTCSSQAELLRTCVSHGGDVDTVAAIAMSAASVCPDIAADLPRVLYDNLESGPFGRPYLEHLDRVLAARFPILARRR